MTVSLPTKDTGQRRLVFRVAGQNHEIDAAEVLEVVRVPPITRVPHGPEALAGIANLRGRPVAVLAMAKVLGKEQTAARSDGRIIVYDHGGALGLLVDDVMHLSNETASNPIDDLPALLDAAFRHTRRTSSERTNGRQADVQAEERSKLIALLSFHVAGQLYGLPLHHIQEVTVLSDDVSVVAGASAAIIGVMPLRGGILPLVSLAFLLGLDHNQLGAARPSAIVVEHEDGLLGLVVDDIDVIRRLPEDAIDVVPSVLQKGRGDARIEAIGRIAETGHLISILSPEKLFADQDVTHGLDRSAGATTMEVTEQEEAAREQFLIFRLGVELYGLPIKAVDEVIRVPDEITRVPGAPGFVMGVINLRGKAIPLIDQRKRFDIARSKGSGKSRAIVLTLGKLQAGFVIDAVSEVKAISAAALSAAPEFSSEQTDVFDRVAHLEEDGRMILLVDPQALLTRAERDVVAAIANDETTAVDP